MDHSMHGMHEMAMSTGFDYTLAFIAGFLGSGHCLGMCGALVSGYFMNMGKTRSWVPYFAYQLTRISVYVMIGFLAATVGAVLVSAGVVGKMQSILQMIMGGVVILLAMGILGWLPFQGSIKLLPMEFIRKGYAAARAKGPVLGAMIAGFLNGMMPCPLTFTMYIEATTATTIMEGGALLMAFGAGTLPTMLLISVAFAKMGAHVRGLMLKAAAVIMILMGLNTINKGLSFYLDEDFKHRKFLHFLKQLIDDAILLMTDMITYINMMIGHIQNM